MKANRAGQFMAFSPLKGYYDLILEKQRYIATKKQLDEEQIDKILWLIDTINIDKIVVVKYYDIDRYVIAKGKLTAKRNYSIDVDNKEILISDIYEIGVEGEYYG